LGQDWSSVSPSTATRSSEPAGALRRSTAWIRAINSRAEKGLVR
jgi:hypothetical protein